MKPRLGNWRDGRLGLMTFVGTVAAAFVLIEVTTPLPVSASDEVRCDVWTRVSKPTAEHKKKVREPDSMPVCYGVGNHCRDRMVLDPATGREIVQCEIVAP